MSTIPHRDVKNSGRRYSQEQEQEVVVQQLLHEWNIVVIVIRHVSAL